MLIQKPKELPYIAVFKLPSGEEFVCKVIEETSDSYLILKPLTIGQTAKGLQFMPILVLADPDKAVSIPKTVIRAEVASDVESQYESLTSGIALPKKSAIIT
jgi:hypothetical protein